MSGEVEVDRMLVRLLGDGSDYNKMLKQAQGATRAFESGIKKAGQNVARLGAKMSLALTVPLVGMGTVAVKQFSKFDDAMTKSTSIMKVTTAEIAKMRDMALKMSASGELQQGPTAIAESYFFLASAGKDAAQSMALVPTVSKFATAGAFDMALATDLLTDAQSALGMSSKNLVEDQKAMTRVSDVLIKANTLANASAQQFAESLTTKSAAALKVFNKSVEEGVAVLAAYADQGIKGANAGENLNRVMTLLANTSRSASEMHERFGFKVFDASGKMRNMADLIENLETVTSGMSDEVKSAVLEMLGFEARVQATILPLLGSSEAIREYEKALVDAGGVTEEVANKQMESFASQMERLKHKLAVLGVEIGKRLVPILTKLTDQIFSMIDRWDGLDKSTKDIIIKMALLAATVGPLLVTLGAFIKILGVLGVSVGLLLNPFVLATAAIVGIGIAFPEVTNAVIHSVNELIKFGKELLIIVGLKEKLLGGDTRNIGQPVKENIIHTTRKSDEEMLAQQTAVAHAKELEELQKKQASARAQQTLKEVQEELRAEAAKLQKIESMRKKGEALTAQFLPEKEKIAKQKQEYTDLFNAGAIGAETLQRALKSLEDQSKKDYKIHKFGINDTALAGTSAAFEKLAQFQERLHSRTLDDAKGSETKAELPANSQNLTSEIMGFVNEADLVAEYEKKHGPAPAGWTRQMIASAAMAEKDLGEAELGIPGNVGKSGGVIGGRPSNQPGFLPSAPDDLPKDFYGKPEGRTPTDDKLKETNSLLKQLVEQGNKDIDSPITVLPADLT